MPDNIIPKRFISKKLTDNILSDNPKDLKSVIIDNGVTTDVCDKGITNHIKARYLPSLKDEFEKRGLTCDKIKVLLNRRYSNIYDIAIDSSISKKNIDLIAAKYALDGIARLNNVIKDSEKVNLFLAVQQNTVKLSGKSVEELVQVVLEKLR